MLKGVQVPTLRVGGKASQHSGQDIRHGLGKTVPISATRSNLQNCLFPAWLELSMEGKAVIIYLHWNLVKQVPLPNDTGPTGRVRAHSIGCLGRVRTPVPGECGPLDTVLWALQSFSSANFSPKEPHCNSKSAPSLLLLCSQATQIPLSYPLQASLTGLCSLLLTFCNLFFFFFFYLQTILSSPSYVPILLFANTK